MINHKKQAGFTLIETVLYLAIVGILFVAVISFHLILGSNATKLASNIDVSRNRRTALSSIEYLIRNADGLWKDVYGDCSSFGSSTLALYFDNDNYLPTTCVENGGGVKISLDNRRVKLSCYPNITYNGQYQACEATSSDSFYLTSSDVIVGTNDLKFSTSTATSTLNGFMAITTYLKTSVLSSGQVDLQADSSATSTTVLRNEQSNGLVSFWKFDDVTSTEALDTTGRYDMTCSGVTQVAGLVSSSPQAYDFDSASSDRCTAGDQDDLNFNGPFTFAGWIKTDFIANSAQKNIINKGNWGTKEGFVWTVYSHSSDPAYSYRMWLRIFDGVTYSNTADTATYILENGVTYHVTYIYDPDNDQVKLYVYEKGVGLINTTTVSGVPSLVNYGTSFDVSDYFDGVLDDIRVYNRALSEEEVYALETQGEN